MSDGYAKLFSRITKSTVWVGKPAHVKLAWITLLAEADSRGCVTTPLPCLAKLAEITLEEFQDAIDIFSRPDPYSRSREEDGRRLVPLDAAAPYAGWRLVTYEKHRSERSADARREQNREAQARWRDRKASGASAETEPDGDNKQSKPSVSDGKPDKPQSAQAEAEAEAERDPPTPLPDRTPRDPLAYLSGGAPQQRPDVVEVFRTFCDAVGHPNRKLRPPGFECPDAAAIVEAIATYGVDACLAVAREAPRDGMVNGSDDDKRQRHDTVRYVFGNPDALARILRAAQSRSVRSTRHGGKTIAEITAEAKALGGDP